MIHHILDTLKNCVQAALPSAALNLFFGPTIHHTPTSTMSIPDNIPENILVFRTITTLLANIPRTEPFTPIDNLQDPHWQNKHTRQELKISDAFAQLAVSQHDVVAVSTVRGGPVLHLLTCANEATQTQAEILSSSLFDQIATFARTNWQLLITRNDRPSDPATSTSGKYPTIIAAQEPEDINGRTAYQYMKDLGKLWIQPSLPTHLWILSKVLMEGARNRDQADFRGNLAEHLFKYTAAMSCRKILRRITNKRVSRPYIESLKKVKTIPTIPIPSESCGPTGDAKHKEEATNDHLLLRFILASEDANILQTKTPNLLALALAKHDPQIPFPIYDDKTSMEFHQLLLELLKCFENAVVELCNLLGQKNPDASQFADAMTDAQVYGYGLLKLARGRALRMHMENIGPLLNKPDHTNAGAPVPVSNAEDPVEKRDDEDEELKALELLLLPNTDQDSAPRKTLTESYVDWLRLTVAHFDAIEIVIQYVMSSNFHHHDISITNLVAPLTSTALYPWKELIKKYLPTTDPTDRTSVLTSNDQILEFLKEAVPIAVRAKELSHLANAALAGWNNYQLAANFKPQQVRQKLPDITKYQDTDINDIANPVLEQLKGWPTCDTAVVAKGIQDLHQKLSDLPPGTSFFASLPNLEFKGALHCEASLASIIDTATKPVPPGGRDTEAFAELLQQLAPFGRVIGVSKRCCPVCFVFLGRLTKGGEDSFVVRGSHSVISACTLPLWTSSSVVDSMVEYFGKILRRDLIALRNNMAMSYGFSRNRSHSTGSDTLSIDSFESYQEVPQDVGRSFKMKTGRH